jgi:hypothetical protein
MESERTDQDLRNKPLQADPETDPDTQDPKTKGTTYPMILEEEPDEAGETEPGKP